LPTTEHGQLFLRLYDSAIRCLHQAAEAWQLNRAGDALGSLRQAVEILRELDAGVDLPSGRQSAADLHRIYGFLLEQLGCVETTGDRLLLLEITGLLEELHQSWKAITC
jgi:flagellin-specific chaperone FliS